MVGLVLAVFFLRDIGVIARRHVEEEEEEDTRNVNGEAEKVRT